MGDEQPELDGEFQLSTSQDKAGRINFDDRGNAFFEWRDDLACEDDDTAQRRRDQALENPGLSLVNEVQPVATDFAPRDCSSGYNPYESGLLDRRGAAARKLDLRELSRWIEARRKVGRRPGE